MTRSKVTIPYLLDKKANKQPITMLTAYDYPTAVLEERAGIDIILCGDSLSMTVYGFDSTLPVTMDMMVAHTAAVKRGAPTAFVIGDMPFMSYQSSPEKAVDNAGRFLKEAGADAVKLEGGVNMAETVGAIVRAGIPVMGHLGLTPQSSSALGGYKAQGRNAENALKIVRDAEALEAAGAFAILIEAIPPEVAKMITESSKVPIISIGAGLHCDGQLLIAHDVLGFYHHFTPRFAKKYVSLNDIILDAFVRYKQEVETKAFPGREHCYGIPAAELEELKKLLEK